MLNFKYIMSTVIMVTLFLSFVNPDKNKKKEKEKGPEEEEEPAPLGHQPRCVDTKITNHIKEFVDMVPFGHIRDILYTDYAVYEAICNFINRFKGNLGARLFWSRLYKHPDTRMLLLYFESFDVDTLAVMLHIFKYMNIDYWQPSGTRRSCAGFLFVPSDSIPMYAFWAQAWLSLPHRNMSKTFNFKMDCPIFNEFLSNLNFFYIIKYLKRIDTLTPMLVKYIFREGYNANWFMFHWGLVDVAPYQKKVGAKENITLEVETTTPAFTTPPSTTPDYYSAG